MQYSMKYELSLVYKWFHSGTLLSAMWLTQKPGDCKGDVFCHKTRDARRKAPTQLVLGRTRRGWAATSSHTCNVNPYPASFTQNINKYACSALHCKTCVLTKFWFQHNFLKSWNRGCIFLIWMVLLIKLKWLPLAPWNLQLHCSVDISSLDKYSIYTLYCRCRWWRSWCPPPTGSSAWTASTCAARAPSSSPSSQR